MPKNSREEIEYVLQRGAEILFDRPELANMELEDVLNTLDDGTSEMMQNRWGVVARIVYASITDFSSTALVLKLAKYKDVGFSCEYVGYLLLTDRGIDSETLLLEADRQGVLDQIVPFVYPNIQYKETFCLELFYDVCTMLNSHINSRVYHTLTSTYSDYIEGHHIYSAVAHLFGDLTCQSQYDIIGKIGYSWYQHAHQEACETTEKLLSYDSVWSKKAGLDFLKISLQYGESEFLKEFYEVETIIQSNQDLWLFAIPLYIRALTIDSHSEKGREIFAKILSRLDRIPEDSLEACRQFISAIQWENTIHKNVDSIFQRILYLPFGKDSDILQMLDRHFYLRLNKYNDSVDLILERLFTVFSSNNYQTDHNKFFEAFPSTKHKLEDSCAAVTEIALNFLLIGEKSQFFFGLGLLNCVGSILKLYQERELSPELNVNCLTEKQMIRIMKGILYFSFDAKYVCRTAFRLLLLAGKIGDAYYQFCIDEIFANYPGTMYNICEQFKSSKNGMYIVLIEKVEHAYQEATKAYTIGCQIQDISPSYDHLRIFQHAQNELMRQSKERQTPSFLDDLFPKRILKYGAKIAFVAKGTKGEMIYRVTSPAHISTTMELPATNTENPVDFTLKRLGYLEEVQKNATNT